MHPIYERSKEPPGGNVATVARSAFMPRLHIRAPKNLNYKSIISALIILLSVLSLIAYAYRWYQDACIHEETDDAYVTGHLHQISSRINDTVEHVFVDDNEHVKRGQLLLTLDPRDFQVRVDQSLAALHEAKDQAKSARNSIDFQDTTASGQQLTANGSINNALSQIAHAESEVKEARAGIAKAEADLRSKEGELARSEIDYKRYEYLAREGAVSLSERDAAKRDYEVALGQRDAARHEIQAANQRFEQASEAVNAGKAQLVQARGQLQLARASAVQTHVVTDQFSSRLSAIERAQAALKEAQLNLSYTRIVAPVSGRIGKKSVEDGQRVEPGQSLLTIVSDDMWVVANYKETQLRKMKVGQHVEMSIDSIPNHKFKGTILSFSPGSGNTFAVLPSDNATGNFTKIVQRLPVKIVFDPKTLKGYEDRVAPGLSVIARTDVSNEVVEHALELSDNEF